MTGTWYYPCGERDFCHSQVFHMFCPASIAIAIISNNFRDRFFQLDLVDYQHDPQEDHRSWNNKNQCNNKQGKAGSNAPKFKGKIPSLAVLVGTKEEPQRTGTHYSKEPKAHRNFWMDWINY